MKPFWHGSRGVQTLQSRSTPQASPSVTGTTRIASFRRAIALFVISQVPGRGLKKLHRVWTKTDGGHDTNRA
jgi:hypothetical protein